MTGGTDDTDLVPEPALTISAVSEETGIPQATLRVWQRRYGLAPTRTTVGGHRRYSSADLERLRQVQRLVSTGVPAGDAARSVLAASNPQWGQSRLVLAGDAPRAARQLAEFATELDGPATREWLREHLARNGVVDTWEEILRPVLAAVGTQWGEVPHGIAVEHLLSHVAAVCLGETVRRVPAVDDPVVLLACVPGELHDLPLVALWAALDPTRASTTLLGARTPAETLLEAASRQRPELVVVYALLPDWAHADLFTSLAAEQPMLAAGPGWDPADLPPGVEHVDTLPDAVHAVTGLV